MRRENDNLNEEDTEETSVERDYEKSFIHSVHRVGRYTMIVGMLVMFFCPFYFYVIKGYDDIPLSAYLSAVIFFGSSYMTNWISSPISYWPLLGSASTYMGYLSGNANGMRAPVASSCTMLFGVDVNSPRGQVISIVGVATSVVSNLIILVIVIIFGDWLLQILPEVISSAFSYITVALFAVILCGRFQLEGQGRVVRGIWSSMPYVIVAGVCRYLFTDVISTGPFAVLITMVCCVAAAYVKHRKEELKESES